MLFGGGRLGGDAWVGACRRTWNQGVFGSFVPGFGTHVSLTFFLFVVMVQS